MLERLLQRTATLLRRRGQVMLLAGIATLLTGLLVVGAIPTVYSARAVVGPERGQPYTGPLELHLTNVRSPATLADVASACDVRGPRTPLEVLAGIPVDPVQRLEARVEPALPAIVVEAAGTSPELARHAANELARRLVDFDAEHRAAVKRAAGDSAVTTEAPAAVPAQVLLTQHRLRHPLLRDADAERRLQELASRLSEDRIAVAAMRAQLDGLTAEGERLEALVRDEATRAWKLDRAERQALAERPHAAPGPGGAPAGAGPSAPAGPPPSRVAQLEAELQQLLATLKPLHPDVRRLMRLLESERQRAASAPVTTPSPPLRPVRSAGLEEASAPRDPSIILITDDETTPQGAAAGAEGPEAWTQRAPSYPAWVEARARAEEVRLALDAREQERTARHREHDLLGRRLAELEGPRLEEARLLARVDDEARAAARVAALPARAPVADPGPPLRLLQAAGVYAERSPWRHFPAWVVASVLLPLLGGMLLEVRDRSVRGPEDLEGLGAPLLGVVPHLRRGR